MTSQGSPSPAVQDKRSPSEGSPVSGSVSFTVCPLSPEEDGALPSGGREGVGTGLGCDPGPLNAWIFAV